MVDKDRYNMRKLPDGMTHAHIRHHLEEALDALQETGTLTDEIEQTIHYVGRLVVDEQLAEFHSRIGRKEP